MTVVVANGGTDVAKTGISREAGEKSPASACRKSRPLDDFFDRLTVISITTVIDLKFGANIGQEHVLSATHD